MTVTEHPDSSASQSFTDGLVLFSVPRPQRHAHPLVDDPPVDPEWEEWAADQLDSRGLGVR
jgi:hypothetical protein